MQQILKNAKVSAMRPIVYSYALTTRGTRTSSIQMVATPLTPTGPVRAIGWLQGSNNQKQWYTIARLITSGTGTQYDGGPFETLWEVMRFRLDSSDDCTVDVFLTQREG